MNAKASWGATITLEIKFPGQPTRGWSLDVTDSIAGCMYPLPKDRELPFCPDAVTLAEKMQWQREWLVKHVADRLARHLMDAILARDPRNGRMLENINP